MDDEARESKGKPTALTFLNLSANFIINTWLSTYR